MERVTRDLLEPERPLIVDLTDRLAALVLRRQLARQPPCGLAEREATETPDSVALRSLAELEAWVAESDDDAVGTEEEADELIERRDMVERDVFAKSLALRQRDEVEDYGVIVGDVESLRDSVPLVGTHVSSVVLRTQDDYARRGRFGRHGSHSE
jgi:hypothetical protein